MAGSTRSSAAVWLLGHPTSELSYARLPACGDVLRVVQYHHQVESMTETKLQPRLRKSHTNMEKSPNSHTANILLC